jgi:hypothetical protein
MYEALRDRLQDNILVDFFLSIGLPDHFICNCFKHIESNFDGELNTKEVFNWIRKEIDCNITLDKTMIQNLYPDCLNKTMDKKDPRFNYLDDPKINQFPNYAFPLGFDIKHQVDQPANEQLSMMYIAGDEKVYMQYLVFYESLEDAYYPAYKLFKDVLDEIDHIDDFEKGPESSEPVTPGFKNLELRNTRNMSKKGKNQML